ncbi:ABC transporter substrate-binding protein [Nakamurella sp.]|uniref:ABC transporter substrate-binding protein n=1 Tax=Nakamurella sp. TaxID=1869182 RepID=UPI003B3B8E5F
MHLIRKSRVRTALLGAAAAGVLLATAACGASTTAPGSTTSAGSSAAASGSAAPSGGGDATVTEPTSLNLNLAKVDSLAAALPDKFKQSGTIIVASDPTYAPNEFLPEGSDTPTGMGIDLANALGQVLGLKVTIEPASFDGIIAGLNAGRYDIGMSSFTDTKEREQSVNFVTYFTAGTSIMVPAGNPKNIQGPTDLCGLPVGAQNGTTQLAQLTDASVDGSVVKACQDAGKEPPVAQGFPKQTDVNAALVAGRIDAYMADSPVVDYAVKVTGDKFEKVGGDAGAAPYGIAVPKEPAELTPALQAAMQHLIDTGAYTKILDNWGLTGGAITTSQINGAIY